MGANHPKHFLTILDLDEGELLRVLDLAGELKRGKRGGTPLAGQALAMIFKKSSTRTRVSFEVGMYQLGGQAIFLSDEASQMGRGETIHDTAKVLSRYVDGIMIRTFEHEEVVELARHATVPVINGLTDLVHPCQLLADLQTMQESFGRDLSGLTVAWIGDGNNMANSWLNASALLGFQLRLACPEGYEPDPAILARAGSNVMLTHDPCEAAKGAHVVTTDVWASMGQEDEAAERERAFTGFQVDQEVMGRADPSAIFMHCLPAHREEEVTAEVMDGPASRVFDEAENRLHAQKALLLYLMGGASASASESP